MIELNCLMKSRFKVVDTMFDLLNETKTIGIILSGTNKLSRELMRTFIDRHYDEVDFYSLSSGVVVLMDRRKLYFKSEAIIEDLRGYDIGTPILLL